MALNNALDRIDLIDILRAFHPKAAEQNILSAHGTFPRIEHIFVCKTSLSKFKKIEIIPSIFSDHSGMKLEINYKKQTVKYTNTCRLNNTLLNNDWVNSEVKEENKN